MKLRGLGRSDIRISPLCLGTMTFGVQTSKEDAFAQLDMAVDAGINCLDTAEAYPVLPMTRETAGDSESIIGEWMKARGGRDKIIIMTKIAGRNNTTARDGSEITGAAIRASLEASLKRLGTDYVDLYQLHWPNRSHYHFRRLWSYETSEEELGALEANFLEVLETLDALIREGKIRAWGSSNETAWGVMKYLELARAHDLPRMMSIQNEYSLLHRIYEPDLHEVSVRENVGLLSYSSLSGGLLTGKYGKDGSIIPENSRRSIEPDIGGRVSDPIWDVVGEYLALGKRHGIEPVHLAYRFVLSQPFTASVIIGATNKDQLAQILSLEAAPLDEAVLQDINALRRKYPIPL